MSEAGKKLSEVATQKSSEVYSTVNDKVRTKTNRRSFELLIFYSLFLFILFMFI